MTTTTEQESQDAHPRGRPRRCIKRHHQKHSPTKKDYNIARPRADGLFLSRGDVDQFFLLRNKLVGIVDRGRPWLGLSRYHYSRSPLLHHLGAGVVCAIDLSSGDNGNQTREEEGGGDFWAKTPPLATRQDASPLLASQCGSLYPFSPTNSVRTQGHRSSLLCWMISSCPNYMSADSSDGEDLSRHQQEVTDGQLAMVTMSLVPGTETTI